MADGDLPHPLSEARFVSSSVGKNDDTIWLLLVILLIAILGIGTVLEAAFWTLLIIGALVVGAFVLLSRLVAR